MQPFAQVADLDGGDGADLVAAQGVEDDGFIDAVDEFGAEVVADFICSYRSMPAPS